MTSRLERYWRSVYTHTRREEEAEEEKEKEDFDIQGRR